MHELINWVAAQHDPGALGIAGAVTLLAAIVLVKVVGLVRRVMWTLGLLIAAGAVGAGDGWHRLQALAQLR